MSNAVQILVLRSTTSILAAVIVVELAIASHLSSWFGAWRGAVLASGARGNSASSLRQRGGAGPVTKSAGVEMREDRGGTVGRLPARKCQFW